MTCQIYIQRICTVMVAPTCIVANLFKQESIITVPEGCTPKLWKRYVDDKLKVIKKGNVEKLTNTRTKSVKLRASSSHMRKIMDQSHSWIYADQRREDVKVSMKKTYQPIPGFQFPFPFTAEEE